MKKTILSIVLLCSYSTILNANLSFGECSGSGTFAQHIDAYAGDKENAVTVGTIPKGIQGLEINLISEADIDIRLYAANGDKIVHWPNGILNKISEETKVYKGVNITYSGFYGIKGKRGHEFIKVTGSTPAIFTMKAFGYNEGDAVINYSWTGKDGCTNAGSGKGHFTQTIPKKAISLVGEIPANIENLEVSLKSDKDIDIQLYGADGTAIIAWPKGLLHSREKNTISYKGMSIEWSGYGGVNDKYGHEYIKITGKTTEKMTMKVYGYQAGTAEVLYNWNSKSSRHDKQIKILKTGQTISYYSNDDGDLQVGEARNYTRNDLKNVVIDNATGLMWQDDEEAKTIKKSWVTKANYKAHRYQDTSGDTATSYCANLTLGNYNDWRLPSIYELSNLINFGKTMPMINSEFINMSSNREDLTYWSATDNKKDSERVYCVRYVYGTYYKSKKSALLHIRCVREMQN